MDEVLAIDRSHVWERWSEDQYLAILRKRNCVGMVALDSRDCVRGAMVYTLDKTALKLHKICVHADHLRDGYGAGLIQKLIGKLSQQKRRSLYVDVPYNNLPAQLFFQSQGFIAAPLADVICFEYTLPESEFHQ